MLSPSEIAVIDSMTPFCRRVPITS